MGIDLPLQSSANDWVKSPVPADLLTWECRPLEEEDFLDLGDVLMKHIHTHFLSWGSNMPSLFLLLYNMMALICYDKYIVYSIWSLQNLVSLQQYIFRVDFSWKSSTPLVHSIFYRKSVFSTSIFIALSTFSKTKGPTSKQKTQKHISKYMFLFLPKHIIYQ